MNYAHRGLGWRRDRPGVDEPAHHLLAKRRAVRGLPPLATPSLRQWACPILDQGAAGSCFSFALVYALQRYYAANMYPNVPLAAPGTIYYVARREEWAGQNPETVPPLEDTGTEPRLGMQAVKGVGFTAWHNYPYPTDEVELYNEAFMSRYVNRQPPPGVLIGEYDQKGLLFAKIIETGAARCQVVDDALKNRLPVIFGVDVDEAFMDNQGSVVSKIDPNKLVGGHMLMVDDSNSQGIGGPNSWSSSWGDNGYFRFSRGVFGSPFVSDVYVIQAAPIMEV